MTDALPTAERERFAHLLDRYARYAAIGVMPIVVIALADLTTGSLGIGPLLDIGLLLSAAVVPAMLHRLARRVRSGEMPSRWRAVASSVVSLAVSGVVGYLIGGTVLAIAAPLASILLIGVAAVLGLGLRRRRRMSAEARGHS
jgi:hypothetical protein